MKLYYAHPISHYGTEHEAKCLEAIRLRFPGFEIINPADKVHSEACKFFDGMPYFIQLCRTCDVVVAAPFHDGAWGVGVYAEATQFSKPATAFKIDLDAKITPLNFCDIVPISITETRHRVRELKAL